MGPLLAGLGVGGLALALAAKESLENLLSSFTIFFDKPFVLGDTVKVGGVVGTVEKVGFRSTRLRTPEKSYVTIPNRKMIDAELDNLSLRTFRRVKQTVGLTYGTPVSSIQLIVQDIQQLIDGHQHTNQDGKAKFTDFGASSLDVMVNYYVDTMDWRVYLDVKQD
ncbi:MAG: mechanosensitive ion channel, partial [Flavobacteriales bacterium]|nr:mechanosensitive ion channel [Flavobacteriales bacterium]